MTQCETSRTNKPAPAAFAINSSARYNRIRLSSTFNRHLRICMTKDFANRGQTAKPAKKRARLAAKPRSSRATPTRNKKNTNFHGPSFSSGAIFGAIVVLLAAYLPEWIGTETSTSSETATASSVRPKVTFEFPDLLKDSEIQVDTSAYESTPPDPSAKPTTFRVQAASFRDKGDANTLRAKLILLNLPATVVTGTSSTGEWHRVVLGPFERRVDANRALTKLREQGISGVILQ
jgi:cell division protein FtsN